MAIVLLNEKSGINIEWCYNSFKTQKENMQYDNAQSLFSMNSIYGKGKRFFPSHLNSRN